MQNSQNNENKNSKNMKDKKFNENSNRQSFSERERESSSCDAGLNKLNNNIDKTNYNSTINLNQANSVSNDNSQENSNDKNFKTKIKNSQIYQRLIYRPFKMGTARSVISVMLYGIVLLIVFSIMWEVTNIKPKFENELYRTDGIVVKNNINEHTGSRGTTTSGIHILTDNNETIRFYYIYKKDLKLADKNLIGKRIVIYSDIPPINFDRPFVDKAVDENGEILKEYFSDKVISNRIKNRENVFLRHLIPCLFILTLIYFINGKNTKKFDVENYWNNQNLKSQTKE